MIGNSQQPGWLSVSSLASLNMSELDEGDQVFHLGGPDELWDLDSRIFKVDMLIARKGAMPLARQRHAGQSVSVLVLSVLQD